MKLEIIAGAGRKKDFWDLRALYGDYSITDMIELYLERYPYNYSEVQVRTGLVNFSEADKEPDPDCLLGKHWELIKLDFAGWMGDLR